MTTPFSRSARSGKYNATKTEYRSAQGFARTYDSKREADYAAQLDIERRAGLIAYWLPQVTFYLPGGVTYRSDFMIAGKDGRVRWIDVKGVDTAASKMKRKQVLDLFGVDIEIVR